MSTSAAVTAAPDKRRRLLWWLIPEVAVIAILLVLFIIRVASGDGLRNAAGERAAALLEHASPAQHHDHGHSVSADDRVFCGVYVFGIEPAGARSIDDVKMMYGYYFCAVGQPGLAYLESYRADGPIVAHLDLSSLLIVPPGPDYQAEVRAMMPDQYEDRCFGGLPDSGVAEKVKRRYESNL